MDLSQKKDECDILGNDLSSIMTDFVSFRDRHTEEHKKLVELQSLAHTQKEAIRLAKAADLCEQRKANQARVIIGQQQAIIDSLQGVVEERNKARQDLNLLREKEQETLRQFALEREVLQESLSTLEIEMTTQVEEMKLQCEKNVEAALQETESCRAEFKKKQSEMEGTFHSLRAHKNEELNLLTLEYEEKLHKVEEAISVMSAQNDLKISEAQATISVLTQRNADLERKLAGVERELQMAAYNIPPFSYQNQPQPSTYQNQPQPSTYQNQPSSYQNKPQPSTYQNNPQPSTYQNNPQPSTYQNQPPSYQNKPQPSTYQNKPQPSTYQNNPQPSTYQNQPSSYQNQPQPASYQNQPQPSAYHNIPQPASYQNQPQPSTYQNQPQPASYQNQPQPSAYHNIPQPASYQNNPQPASYQNQPQPASYQNQPQPSAYQNNPQPASFQNNPQPASYQNKPQPFNSFGMQTANKTAVQKTQYTGNQGNIKVQSAVNSAGKRMVIQPLPFIIKQEANPGKRVTFETKRRKLFTQQDEFM